MRQKENPGALLQLHGRRDVIVMLGGAAAAWRSTAYAQPAPLIPVVGFLNPRSPNRAAAVVRAFQKGFSETGFVEGQNVAVEYRWAEDRIDRLPELAADLVRREVSVIVAGATPSARAAMAATKSIPIVFTTAGDPVRLGLVSSLGRPTGNVTGATFFSSVLVAKQVELLHELVPKAAAIGILVNPKAPTTEPSVQDAQAAAKAVGKQIRVLPAGSVPEIDATFASLAQYKIDALLVAVDPLFDSRPDHVVALAARYAVPTVYYVREFAEAGGLISYGAELTDAYHQAGVYAGLILKGAKPADLPVMQPTKFQLVINRKAAVALDLDIPQAILVRADEVIE